jgi:hypothetical protein
MAQFESSAFERRGRFYEPEKALLTGEWRSLRVVPSNAAGAFMKNSAGVASCV